MPGCKSVSWEAPLPPMTSMTQTTTPWYASPPPLYTPPPFPLLNPWPPSSTFTILRPPAVAHFAACHFCMSLLHPASWRQENARDIAGRCIPFICHAAVGVHWRHANASCILLRAFIMHSETHLTWYFTQPWQALSCQCVKLACVHAGALSTDPEGGTKCDRCSQWNSNASWRAQAVPSTGQLHW